ncbi:MAG: hypothetical protein RLN99_13185, partial [Kiloniellaceae bacterium]
MTQRDPGGLTNLKRRKGTIHCVRFFPILIGIFAEFAQIRVQRRGLVTEAFKLRGGSLMIQYYEVGGEYKDTHFVEA